MEIIKDFIIILLAVLAADGLIIAWQNWHNRRLDMGCDYCEELLPLNRTPDRRFYLCRNCMNAFLTEHADVFSEAQVKKARRGYRHIKRRKKRSQ